MEKGTYEELHKVLASAQDVCPLPVGMSVPQISLTDAEGNSFDLTAAVRGKPSVLVFYRGGW